MAKAMWKGAVLAESDNVQIVEGNVYFPRESIAPALFRKTATHTTCPWKGEASYFDVVVDGAVNHDAAWVYEDPKQAAQQIKGHVAFWKGVTVER